MKKITLNQGEIDIKKFKKGKRISKGGFGVVYQVTEKETGNLFAAKVIDCDDDEEKCNEMIKREISIMINANHPTIIKFIGYSKIDFQDENNITIIMELATNGSLKAVLKKIQESDGPKNYTNTSRQIILIGVSRGMKYLHDRNIIHRDLKTDNILLDDDFHPHITDFGMSKIFDTGHSRSQTTFGGTLFYEAPEILRGEKYGIEVDVYSFGILMFEVLTDCVPYPKIESSEVGVSKFIENVVNRNYRPKFTVPIKKSLKNLIERCWSDDPKERPTFGEIFNKLSNRNNDDKDENDDFLLEDVDVDEVNLYVEDISEVTDHTENLMNKIHKMETEIKQLKKENDKLKSENNKYKDEINKLKSENNKLKDENILQRNKIEHYEKGMKNIIDKHNEEPRKEEPEKSQIGKIQAKKSIEVIKNDKNEWAQSIIICGYDGDYRLGEKPTNKDKYRYKIISPPVNLSLDSSSLLSYSIFYHTILVMSDGSLKGAGDNCGGQISATLPKKNIDHFTDFCIKDGSGRQLAAVSAVCLAYGTLYMLSKIDGSGRQLVLCHKDINGGKQVFLDIGNHHPVSLFGGYLHSAAIGSEGEVIFIYYYSFKNLLNSPIASVSLPDGEKASSVACCNNSVVVLSSNGRVFTSPTGDLKFSIVSELLDHEIVCVSGIWEHFLAVSKEGRVFGRGSNKYGKLGLGEGTESVSSFTEIQSLVEYKIRAAYAGAYHSLFETHEGKILACGLNKYSELLLKNCTEEYVYSPTETTITSGSSFCVAGSSTSTVFIGGNPPPNTPNKQI